MHQHRQDLLAQRISTAIHARTHGAFNHRIDNLRVRRIERQTQMHRPPKGRHVRAKALVVFHITGWQVFGRCVVKLRKQVRWHLAQCINQHIQATTVGHADNDFLHPFGTRRLNQLVHGGNKALPTFERKTLLTNIFRMQETLQAFCRRQTIQNMFFLLAIETGLAANAL